MEKQVEEQLSKEEAMDVEFKIQLTKEASTNDELEAQVTREHMAQIDDQVATLLKRREELANHFKSKQPSALNKLMSSKRKIDKISDNSTFKALRKALDKCPKTAEKKEAESRIFDQLTEEQSHKLKKVKNSRENYSDDVKKLVVELKKSFKTGDIADATKIPKTNIKKWTKDAKDGKTPVKRGKFPEIEQFLKDWILDERRRQKHVSVRRMVMKGKRYARIKGFKDAKFSWGWISRFMKRTQCKLRKPTTKITKPLNELKESAAKFIQKIRCLLRSGLYDLHHFINMDETGVPTESITTKTITHPDEEAEENKQDTTSQKKTRIKHPTIASVNKDKENTTMVLATSMKGDKLDAMIIHDTTGKRKLSINTPGNLYAVHRPEGSYMDSNLMEKWATYVLRPYSRSLPANKRGLLILDNFKGHLSVEARRLIQDFRYDIEFLPPNTTKYIQPLDIGIEKSQEYTFR